jgi:hypothetical protein
VMFLHPQLSSWFNVPYLRNERAKKHT